MVSRLCDDGVQGRDGRCVENSSCFQIFLFVPVCILLLGSPAGLYNFFCFFCFNFLVYSPKSLLGLFFVFFLVFGHPTQDKTSEDLVIFASFILCFGISNVFHHIHQHFYYK